MLSVVKLTEVLAQKAATGHHHIQGQGQGQGRSTDVVSISVGGSNNGSVAHGTPIHTSSPSGQAISSRSKSKGPPQLHLPPTPDHHPTTSSAFLGLDMSPTSKSVLELMNKPPSMASWLAGEEIKGLRGEMRAGRSDGGLVGMVGSPTGLRKGSVTWGGGLGTAHSRNNSVASGGYTER